MVRTFEKKKQLATRMSAMAIFLCAMGNFLDDFHWTMVSDGVRDNVVMTKDPVETDMKLVICFSPTR